MHFVCGSVLVLHPLCCRGIYIFMLSASVSIAVYTEAIILPVLMGVLRSILRPAVSLFVNETNYFFIH